MPPNCSFLLDINIIDGILGYVNVISVIGERFVATDRLIRCRVRPEFPFRRAFLFSEIFMAIKLSDHFTYKKLLAFVAPSVIMLVFTSVYSIVDGLFVSNFVGTEAVTATNLIFPLIIIFGSIGFMLGSGGSALVSKTLGEGKKKLANEYFSLLVYFTSAIGVLIMIVGQIAVPWCSKLLAHASEGIIYDYCVLYGRILLAGQPFFILQNIFQSFFVTAEKPRLGLFVTVGAGIMNIVLDAVLVPGLGLGLAGAAWATFSSQVFGGIIPVFYFISKNNSLLRLTRTKFYFKAVLKSATNGSSEFLSNVSASIIMLLYNEQLFRYAGYNGVTAYTAIGYIMMIFSSVFMGFAAGVVPVIGFNFGAQNREELKALFKKSLVVVTVSGILMTALSTALTVPLVGMFGFNEELTLITRHGNYIYSLSYLLCGYGIFGSALFTALNNGAVSAVISFTRTLILRIAAVLVLPLFFGLDGVWFAAPVSEIAACLISFAFIAGFRKKYGYI